MGLERIDRSSVKPGRGSRLSASSTREILKASFSFLQDEGLSIRCVAVKNDPVWVDKLT
jgi:hypothetical protein